MATMLETPSRIWRRIEAVEARDMPSLPSLPPFEDSQEVEESQLVAPTQQDDEDQYDDLFDDVISSPLQSTPTATHYSTTTAFRAPSSTSSTARFAHSIASRSNRSSSGMTSRGMLLRKSQHDSFDIPSLPDIPPTAGISQFSEEAEEEDVEKSNSVPDVYLPPPDEDEENRELSLTDALESVSRSNSPFSPGVSHDTPKKSLDFSIKSEPKASPFEKYRNVAVRNRIANPRARTPSLTRTLSSQTTSPTHSTPQSHRSPVLHRSQSTSPISAAGVALPRSLTNSPAVQRPTGADESIDAPDFSNDTQDSGARSMDITDVHISPPRLDGDDDVHEQEVESREDTHEAHDDSNEGSQEEREPTFSSEGDETPHAFNRQAIRNTSNFSSPAQSLAFTPTPAFPRPRARFELPAPPSDLLSTPAPGNENEDEHDHDGDLVTPHTRRRSFLLSVINSTARPRMKLPTPHPKRLGSPGTEESTSGPSSSASPSGVLQTAFAGVTPRPRMAVNRRSSHPLSKTMSASPDDSDEKPQTQSSRVMWATPAYSSPYDGTAQASFISTASSHDLTTHQRVNTSFDPAMGFGAGAPGHGVGKFNAGKLNTYLHGLNRRLQEENEVLLERLRKLDEEKKGESLTGTVEPNRRLSAGSRRASAVGTLGDVQEDMAEAWLEEKAELEDAMKELKTEAMKIAAEKQDVDSQLVEEKAERERDRQRWMARMGEVEKGVSGIIADLEEKVTTAETRAKKAEDDAAHQVKEIEKALVEARGERDVAMDRASKAERVLESGKELGGALKEANDRVSQVMGDLRNANAQIKDLEDEVMHQDARIDELEKEAKDSKDVVSGLEEELATQSDNLAAERTKTRNLQDTIKRLDEELRSTKDYVDELEEEGGEAVERIEKLERDLASVQEKITSMTTAEYQTAQDMKSLQTEALKAQETARQMEEALEESEQKMMHDEEALADLRAKIAALERERQREVNNSSRDISRGAAETGPTEAEYQALEEELEEAHRELARVNTLLNQSPARKAMDRAKDTRIEMLEREKEELLERNKALRMTFNEMSTPSRVINTPGISPIHRQVLNMSIRLPRTPGGPLKDISWLKTPGADASVTPLISEINRLQRELDLANESIDDKLDKLEDAGLGVVGLTKKLEDARAKISSLEDEIARLTRKEERRLSRLSRARCQKCNIKLDLRSLMSSDESSTDSDFSKDLLPSEPPTPPTRTSEALKANLESVNKHLDELKHQWEKEKQQLIGEKAALESTTSRLTGQVKLTKEEARKAAESGKAGERAKANVLNELEKAKKTISVLETELSSERSRLRTMITEQDRVQREKKQILTDLQRTESDMDDVKNQLQRYKKENQEIEKELRENANIEQKVRLLETRVVENAETIDQLRQERTLLASDHKELQRRFAEVSETANNLRKDYTAHSNSHDQRRHELDLHRLEIDDLRRALEDREHDLRRAEKEKEKISTEKSDVARIVAGLEADLRRVRRDAEEFGHDLKLLRREKESLEARNKEELASAERAKKQAQTQIRLLNDQLDSQKEKTMRALEQLNGHVCAADESKLSKMKAQHNKECKGLIVQIRYLKAKFTRESLFREDLTYQKQYLLVLLSQFEKSERTIFASIARIGFPVAPAPSRRKPRTLKSVALLITFLGRIKCSSDSWRKESAAKQAVAAALDEVRRKRATIAV
ncbi:hypothetical protein BDN70DRAFT_878644 [Pholiota conissans]|uniref:Pericentrin/AKAP-450 centrosomal targeting domain-containing protein n=1 Tax=Pholiota conissans TaxID=109636 RepID=A0A9P5Z3T9_9AGAR|nr:hypothetical protein BDN70DRAFT_878644 [Pholiota conissans]